MREIRWHASPGPEIRLQGTSTTARYGFASSRRSGSGSLFHEPYDGGHGELKLPAALLPCVSHDGEPIDISAAAKDVAPSACLIPATLVLPAGHPPVVEHSGKTELEVVNAFWLSGLSEPQIDEVTRRCGALPGILIQQDESVASLGHAFPRPLWIQRLPRIVLSPRSEIADNTDAGLSMGRLLERFVHRFSAPQHALPHLCIATGYLYQRGLSRTLALLQNPAIKTIHLLFSGKTDWATARALTAKLSETLREEMDQEPTDALWRACQDAAQTGRLQVRVYTDAFLHAKLFLGHDGDDDLGKLRNGYAVIGSSNVSGPGLQGGGNLELDVSIDSRDRTTELYQWFQHRWNEGSLPEPALLEVLSAVRPLPPPVFQIEGLDAVWRAGAEGRLGPPAHHLALLAQIHGRQLEALRPPSDEAFPHDVERQIEPTPEQAEGVLALAQRLMLVRVAFLADSVGLGKTITALGLAAYLARNNMLGRAALIAPQKLWDQWQDDARRAGIPFSIIQPINRHKLERWTPEDARAQLAPFDLLIVEEAHESLRQRGNKLWQNLRAHLRQHPGCRLVLVSATPWNNRREDIYNYLLLGWQDGRPLREHYRALGATPLQHYLSLFTVPPATGARMFEDLPRERYRQIFDAVFVQRTRSTLELLGRALNFPERRIYAANTPASESHDALYAALSDLLATLNIPYQEPFRAILRASGNVEEEQEEEAGSNLKRSFLIQLYKRAESSLFALAISLSRINRRLLDFQRTLEALRQAPDPKAALASYLRESYLRLDDEALGVEEENLGEWLSAAEKVRYTALNDLLRRLDGPATKEMLERLIREQIVPDRVGIAQLRARLSFSLDEQSPKDLLLCRVARHAFSSGYKPILVASYADTATRAFIRLIDLFPDARIALALGGGEAWMYRPERTRRAPLTAAEWEAAMELDPQDRRLLLLQQAARAEQIPRDVVLDAFSPRARHCHALTLATTGGEIDILVGSEAISVGQNLQDSTCLIHLDLPWNPMVIEQRIGRIDRRGGGRPDPERPDGRRIVDVHYCWSDAAVEREVSLRSRLSKKASGAIDDTNFDEILLHELAEEVRRRRDDRAAQAAADVLGRRQHELAESQNRRPDGGAPSGSALDGLRRLAAWARENEPAPVEPTVAAGQRGAGESGAFILTLELTPLDRLGAPLPGGPLHESMVISTTPTQEPDLERTVIALTEGGDATALSHLPRRQWTQTVLDLDQRLGKLREELRERHNREYQARMGQHMAPVARRAPTDRLRGLLVQAKDTLEAALKQLRRDDPAAEQLRARKEKVEFLRKHALQPATLPDLISEQGEVQVSEALAQIRDFPQRFIEQDFDATFEKLCGVLYEARRAESAQPELPAIAQDGLWADLRLRVIAATYQTAATQGDAP